MKKHIRNEIKHKRLNMEPEDVAEKSFSASLHFLQSELYKNSYQLMLYKPLGNETDTSEIINKAFADVKKLIFPVTDEKSGDIFPCYAKEDTQFKKGAFSVSEPESISVAVIDDIDVIIVPGIAFDKKGNRLGFGKGCYDGFLKKCPALKIGFCYEFQVVDEIPAEPHDIRMDYIVTENGLINCE